MNKKMLNIILIFTIFTILGFISGYGFMVLLFSTIKNIELLILILSIFCGFGLALAGILLYYWIKYFIKKHKK